MNGPTPRQAKWLKRKGKLREGTYISSSDIRKTVELFQGTGAYDRISYDLKEIDTVKESYQLSLNLHQPSPDVVGFGIHYDTEESAALLFTLGLNEKRLSGPKLNLRGRFSFNPELTATLTYPVSTMASFKLSYDICWQFANITLQNSKSYNYRDLQQEIKTCMSSYQINDLQVDAGLLFTINSISHVSNINDDETADPPTDKYFVNNQLIGAYFNFNYDNLDHYYFATRGINFTVQGHIFNELNRQPQSFQDLSISLQSYLTPNKGRLTIIPQFFGRIVWGDVLYTNLCNVIGGEVAGRYTRSQMPFVGINGMTVVDDKATILRCDLRYNFFKSHYLTAIGNVAISFGEPQREDPIDCFTGIGIRYSYKSPLGPISLTGQWSDLNHSASAYFSFGHYF